MTTTRIVLGNESARTPEHEAALARLGELGATLATTEAAHDTTKATLEKVTHERDALRRVYQLLLQHYELLRRHIYMARAERIDVTELESTSRQSRNRSTRWFRRVQRPTKAAASPMSRPNRP